MRRNILFFFFVFSCLTCKVFSQGFDSENAKYKSSIRSSYKNGSGILGNVYNNSACRLNYAVDSWQVSKRSAAVGTPPGLGMPAIFNFTKLPDSACFVVDTAFLWWILSDFQQVCFYDEDTANNYCSNPTSMLDADFNFIWCCPYTSAPLVSITNPNNITYVDTGIKAGQDGSKNWGELFTSTYRMGIPPSIISGNGTYTLDIFGQDEYGIDGFMLMIIYRDPSATYQGTLIIDDGCFTRSIQDTTCGLPTYDSITGFNACGNSSYANAFLLVSDLQRNIQPTFQAILNGNIVTDSANFFNFVDTSTTVTAGQSVSQFGIIPDTTSTLQDCYTLGVAGLYYQTTSCVVCTPDTSAPPPLILSSTVIDYSCSDCNGSAAVIVSSGHPPYNYLWDAAAGSQTDSIATGLCAGTYTVTVKDGSCQMGIDTVTVLDVGAIVASAWPDTTICEGDTIQLNASGGSDYSWSPSAGLSNTTIANPIANPITTITYTVIASDSTCLDTAFVTVTVINSVVVSSPDTTICKKESVQFNVSGGISYSWSPSTGLNDTTIANPIATPDTTIIYTVIISSPCNLDTNTITITVNSVPANAWPDTTICERDSVQLNASGGANYLWSPSTGLSETIVANPIANPITSTIYTVTVEDSTGCIGMDSVIITVNVPVVSAGPDDTITHGGNTTLNASGSGTFLWNPSIGLNDSIIPNPIASPDSTTTYTVRLTDFYGCTSFDTVTVYVIKKRINVPSAFTPNGDGKNDILYIIAAIYVEIDFKIFNRWGELVFEAFKANDPSQGWDGTYKGKLQPVGTYVYYVKGEFFDGELFRQKGNITLIR